MAIVGGQTSTIAVLSLTSSIVTAAFISASISVEKDADSKCRRESPDFYGLLQLDSKWKTVCTSLLIMLLAALCAGLKRNLWLPILEDVLKWLNDGLVVWMEEDPEWFDDFTRSSVPDDLVNDKAVLKKLRGAKVEEGSEGEGGEGEGGEGEGAKGEETITGSSCSKKV
ncbi:hypothetical protein TrVE_jg12105 [Triparma verrucosa]|uniref:Uncharacterized protein n=1 Tax=Triparma verrucosa TaxID=1606542 RepID=A0A9W7C942_9STRA|nr:hypothetical protein TrVE_jg12105 [Triparma verrucosa]